MKRICLVYDSLGDPKRFWTFPLIDALVEPMLPHLDAEKVDAPQPGAVNVRFWTNCESGVFFNHGIADKNARNRRHVEQFDVIFHSGPRWQRKYLEEGLPASRLRQVGYTKIDTLLRMEPRGPRSVLWAPTWSALWPKEYAELAELLSGVSGIVQSHHCLDAPYQVTMQPLVDADVVIADGGSTLYEAWALGKPVVFPDFAIAGTKLIRRGSIEAEIYERQIGYHVQVPDDLLPTIERARSEGITQAERDFIDDVLPPELRGTSGKAHADALLELAA